VRAIAAVRAVGGAARRAGTFRRLDADDRRLLVTAYASLALVDIALRALGFRRLMARVPEAHEGTVRAAQHRRAGRFAYWLEVASHRHVVRARCLHRSLALHFWLRRKGLPSQLRIGVMKADGALMAHAWVEMEGRVVNDRQADVAAFAVLDGLDAAAALSNRMGR
jgi:hypothetical protein